MRSAARAVVIGGGVGGASILYWLTKLGWSDVVLCERADLTSGSTFHSAGLVGQLRSSLSLTKMMMRSVELYRTVGAEVALETGWHEVGSLRLASSEERMQELRRQAGWAKTFGLPLELISAEEAQERFPLMVTDGVLGASWLPTDGYLDPSQLTFELAERARGGGARMFTSTRVVGIDVERGRVRRVRTDRGDVECEAAVIAAGMFSAEVGRLAGVHQATRAETPTTVELKVALEEEAAIGAVVQTVATRGGKILTLKKVEPTLEDVFIELVGHGLDDEEKNTAMARG